MSGSHLSSKELLQVELVSYEDLNEGEKLGASYNGSGAKSATYMRVSHRGERVFTESDAMEREDATFHRDLNWIVSMLKYVYELGQKDAATFEPHPSAANPLVDVSGLRMVAAAKIAHGETHYQLQCISNCADEIERLQRDLERYKQSLYQANGCLMQLNQEPVKLDYSAHEPSVDPYFCKCPRDHVAYSVSFDECPSCKIERERTVETGPMTCLSCGGEAVSKASQPSERPQFAIELPDGDTRKLHVWFTEKRPDGKWHISISVDDATTQPPATIHAITLDRIPDATLDDFRNVEISFEPPRAGEPPTVDSKLAQYLLTHREYTSDIVAMQRFADWLDTNKEEQT
jgi:hypothetical protein